MSFSKGPMIWQGNTAKMLPEAIQFPDGSLVESYQLNGSVTKEFTGFDSPASVIPSYDSTTRKVTLTGTWKCYWRGREIPNFTTGWVSDAHDSTLDQVYYLTYNGTSFAWSTTPWTFDLVQIIAAIYYTNFKLGIKETHGLMQSEAHQEFHETVKAYRLSGGDFSGYTLASTTAANRRPLIAEMVIKDEDNPTTLPALGTASYEQFYLSGTTTPNFLDAQAEIVSVTGAVPNYNQFTGGAWQQTAFPVNAYGAVFVIGIPVDSHTSSQKYRFSFIQPQTVSTSLTDIQALVPDNISLGLFNSLTPEIVFFGKIIIRYTAANWVLTSVELLQGTRAAQTLIPQGSFLSSVSHDATLTGEGTVASPLSVIAVVGRTDGNSPSAGQVGEPKKSSAFTTMPSTATVKAVTSIELTAGAYLLSAQVNIDPGALTITRLQAALTSLVGTVPGTVADDSYSEGVPNLSAGYIIATIPMVPAEYSETTTVYLNMTSNYTGTPSGNQLSGKIIAVRR
jgi:hypothetical protein